MKEMPLFQDVHTEENTDLCCNNNNDNDNNNHAFFNGVIKNTKETKKTLHKNNPRNKEKTFRTHSIPSTVPALFPLLLFNDSAVASLRNDSWPFWEWATTTVNTSRQTDFSIYNDFNISHNISNNDSLEGLNAMTEISFVPYVLRPETYIVPVLFALIFVVGVLGNGTLIVVFLSVRQMRNVPNTYILSLALADLLVIVTTVPLTSTVYTVDSWPWGGFLCTLSEFIKDVSIGVSVFTLTALSGDRYFAIVDPLRKFHAHGGGKRATRVTIAIAISIWILAIICGLPALIGTHVKKIDINRSKSFAYCYPFPEEWGPEYAESMVLLRFLVYYAIPFIIIGAFYALIARHLMYAANVPGEMQGAIRQVRARRKVAVTVLAFVLIFGICFLPYHVFMLWFYYCPTAQMDYNAFWHVLRIVGFCLSFANSCANPVALYFVSGSFRKHFNRYLFCRGSVVRHKKRKDTGGIHRDTSLTSTVSKRFQSRRSYQHQSTIRSRLHETTISTLPVVINGSPNGYNNGSNNSTITGIAITSPTTITAATATPMPAIALTDLTEISLTKIH